MSRILFIDANQYLNLFRTDSGKKLLDALEEQQKYIFVTTQIVYEVERNKVREVASFLAKRQLKLDSVAVPDHLLSTTDSTVDDMRKQLRAIDKSVDKTKEDFRKLADDLPILSAAQATVPAGAVKVLPQGKDTPKKLKGK